MVWLQIGAMILATSAADDRLYVAVDWSGVNDETIVACELAGLETLLLFCRSALGKPDPPFIILSHHGIRNGVSSNRGDEESNDGPDNGNAHGLHYELFQHINIRSSDGLQCADLLPSFPGHERHNEEDNNTSDTQCNERAHLATL